MTDEKRDYMRQWRQKRKREKGGWITKAYGNMRNRNRSNFGKELDFTKDEFEKWLDGNYGKLFDELFRAYVVSNCEKDIAPSIDRLNDYLPYSLNNIRLTTWKVNNEKGRFSKKNKEQCGEMAKKVWSRRVAQYTIGGELVNVFPSTREAERQLPFVDHSAIAKVCRGEKKTHKGFVWEYVKEDE